MGCGNSKDAQDTMSKPYDGPRTKVSSALVRPEDIVDFPEFPDQYNSDGLRNKIIKINIRWKF